MNRLALCILLFAGSLSPAAVTPLQSTTYSAGELYGFDDLVDGQGFIEFYEEEAITGLTKFDPALGELREIRLFVTGSARLQVILSSGSIDDEEASFTALYEPSFEDFSDTVDVGLLYSPTGEDIGYSLATDSIDAPTLGVEDDDPEFWTFDSFYFDDYLEEEFFFYDGENDPPLETSIRFTDFEVNRADFIGEGEVTGLYFFGWGTFDTTQTTIENLTEASLDVFLNYDAGEISLQYFYRPRRPEITHYSREGNRHQFTFTDDAGLDGWQLRGGSDPSSPENDHTNATEFVESEPGIYQATVDLPDLNESRYFFVIARPETP